MKRFFKIFTIATIGTAALFAYSCQYIKMDDIKVSPEKVDLMSEHVTVYDDGRLEIDPIRINVEATHDWHVQSAADWITVTDVKTTGQGAGFNINVEVYGPNVGDQPRTGIVVVTSKVGEIPVVVSQAPYEKEEGNDPDDPYVFEDFSYEGYLGDYTLHADLFNIWAFSNGGTLDAEPHLPSPHTERVKMKNYRGALSSAPYDFMAMEYVLKEMAEFSYNSGYINTANAFSIGFDYRAATEDLSYRIVSYLGIMGQFTPVRDVFMYFNENENMFHILDTGQVTVKLQSNGDLVIGPKWRDENGDEWDLYFAAYTLSTNPILYPSMDALYNIKFVKDAPNNAAAAVAETAALAGPEFSDVR